MEKRWFLDGFWTMKNSGIVFFDIGQGWDEEDDPLGLALSEMGLVSVLPFCGLEMVETNEIGRNGLRTEAVSFVLLRSVLPTGRMETTRIHGRRGFRPFDYAQGRHAKGIYQMINRVYKKQLLSSHPPFLLNLLDLGAGGCRRGERMNPPVGSQRFTFWLTAKKHRLAAPCRDFAERIARY